MSKYFKALSISQSFHF